MASKVLLYMDDSGILTVNEDFSVYAGLVFTTKKDKDTFLRKYQSILTSIKCGYCTQDIVSCDKACPEIKSSNIKNTDKRRLMNLIKKQRTFGLVFNHSKIYDHIMNDKYSRGRFKDYGQKMMIKEITRALISEGVIDNQKHLTLIINSDEETTKSNGYYDLRKSIIEELEHGIHNFDYGFKRHPMLFGGLHVEIHYKDSKIDLGIQAADMIAGEIRKTVLRKTFTEAINELNSIYNHIIIIP